MQRMLDLVQRLTRARELEVKNAKQLAERIKLQRLGMKKADDVRARMIAHVEAGTRRHLKDLQSNAYNTVC